VWGGRLALALGYVFFRSSFRQPTTRVEKSRARYDGALNGEWRDLRTLFEFAGIYPPKDAALPTDSLRLTWLSEMAII